MEDPVTELINSSLLTMGEFVVGSLSLLRLVVAKLRVWREFAEILRATAAVRIMVEE